MTGPGGQFEPLLFTQSDIDYDQAYVRAAARRRRMLLGGGVVGVTAVAVLVGAVVMTSGHGGSAAAVVAATPAVVSAAPSTVRVTVTAPSIRKVEVTVTVTQAPKTVTRPSNITTTAPPAARRGSAAAPAPVPAPATSRPVVSRGVAGEVGNVAAIAGGVRFSGVSWGGSTAPISATLVITGPSGDQSITLASAAASGGSWFGTVPTGAGPVSGHLHVRAGSRTYDTPTWSVAVTG